MAAEKILVVDDDNNICELLRLYLEKEGYEVTIAHNGADAVKLFQEISPNLMLLDIMLPVLDGWQVCREIREISAKPIIMVTAKGEVFDKVLGLELGADDYMVKPFDTKELLARVAVRLREYSRSPLSAVYTCGSLTLDTASRSVSVMGTLVMLTRTEFAILKLLMQNPGQVLAKSVLLDRLSMDTPDCTESSLKTHVSHLRSKLREVSGQDHIEAVWGIGLRLRV